MSKKSLRLAFAGTPELAAHTLKVLLEQSPHKIIMVLTQADKPCGRGRRPRQSPVKKLALAHGISLFQPLRPAQIDTHKALSQSACLVAVAYGMLLPETVLSKPSFGCLNVHLSLLPRWRGAAPIQRAIEAGDKETGVTIMQMDSGLDTGPIILQRTCPVLPEDTSASLHDRLAELAGRCLLEVLDVLAREGRLNSVPQDASQSSYATKITRSEAAIDWHQSATQIVRQIRAFNPKPVSHTKLAGWPMRIWQAESRNSTVHCKLGKAKPGDIIACTKAGIDITTGQGVLRILQLQIPGKRAMNAADFLNGHPQFSHKVATS